MIENNLSDNSKSPEKKMSDLEFFLVPSSFIRNAIRVHKQFEPQISSLQKMGDYLYYGVWELGRLVSYSAAFSMVYDYFTNQSSL